MRLSQVSKRDTLINWRGPDHKALMDTFRFTEIIVESSDKTGLWTINSPASPMWRRIRRSGGEFIGTAPVKMISALWVLPSERRKNKRMQRLVSRSPSVASVTIVYCYVDLRQWWKAFCSSFTDESYHVHKPFLFRTASTCLLRTSARKVTVQGFKLRQSNSLLMCYLTRSGS